MITFLLLIKSPLLHFQRTKVKDETVNKRQVYFGLSANKAFICTF